MTQLFLSPWSHYLSGSAAVYAGAKLNFYKTGTSTQQDTYTDSDLSVAHANPVVADASGYFDPIYLDEDATPYKIVLTDSGDNVLQTVDPYEGVTNFTLLTSVGTYAALKARTPPSSGSAVVYVLGRSSASDGAEGAFVWDSSDLSSEVTADTLEAFYVPPDTDSSGSSGCWVRENRSVARPEFYGAVGDGSTDDTLELQAALDSGLDVIGRPDATYLIGSGLDLDISDPIIFNLRGAAIKANASINMLTVDNAGHSVINGNFDGDNINGTVRGVVISSDLITVRDNYFYDIGASAVYVPSAQENVIITHNKIDNCGSAASVSSPDTASILLGYAEKTIVSENEIIGSVIGIYATGTSVADTADFLSIINNKINGTNAAASDGIKVLYYKNSVITGNQCDAFLNGAAIYMLDSRRVHISKNHSNINGWGINIEGSDSRYLTVSDNHLTSDGYGIVGAQITDSVITGNIVNGATNYGISVGVGYTSSQTNNIISNNHIRDASEHGIYIDHVFDSQVIGNNMYDIDKVGINVFDSDYNIISNNDILNANADASTYNGINIATSDRNIVQNNYVRGNAVYSISIGAGSTKNVIRGNRDYDLGTGGINDAGTTTDASDNTSVD